jgi:HTH-type transcriptional regulator / antitoxin HigA
MRAAKATPRHHQPDSYFQLVQAFPLVVIRDDASLDEALAFMEGLLSKELDDGEVEYLDALGELVAAYESKHHSLPHASDADMLRHLLESRGVNQARLAEATGVAKSTISEVLSGKKKFSRHMIGAFAEFFQVSKAALSWNL